MTHSKSPGFEEAPAPAFAEDYDEHSAAADADVAAGRVVPHAKVAKWMQSIIDGKPKPMPKSWLK